MKEGWEYKKLGDLGTFVRGGNFSKKDFVENGFPCIHYGQIHMKFGIETFKHISSVPAGMVKPDRCAHKGDLVIAITSEDDAGSCKCTAWMGDYDAYVGGHTAIYRHTMQPKYVSYYFMSPFFQKDKLEYTHGFKVVEISPKDIAKITIPVPPLSEQQSIVNYLDSAFAKIDAMKANAEKALNEAKALFQASLKEMLEPKEGWEEKKLGEMSEIQSGFAFKSTQFQKRGEFQVIRMGNVRPGIIRYNESPVFIDSVDESTIEKALLKVGDMIITQTGSRNKRDYGFTVLIDKENLLLNQRIARIRVVNTITNKYLLYYSWTDYFRDQYFANEGGTVGQGNVGIDAIRYAVISYPPLSEQQSIVATLDSLKSKVDRLQANYEKISQECDALKQAILRQVFE